MNRKREKLVGHIPDLAKLADSLNAKGAIAVKWAVNGSQVVYAKPIEVDWRKEFEAVLKDSVNDVRYKESYDISDSKSGQVRTVIFSAKSDAQEIQSTRVVLDNGVIIEYEVQKSRSTFFSSSSTIFRFRNGSYELETDQKITGVFNQRQFIAGRAVSNGSLWRGVLDLGGAVLPFQFILADDNSGLSVINGIEFIGFNDLQSSGDSVFLASDYFNTRFEFVFQSDSALTGRWVNNHYDDPRVLSFTAARSIPCRFAADSVPSKNLSGSHKAVFYTSDGVVEDSTVLMLNQRGHMVEGSFLTETGDYRFLEGVIRNDSLYLSTMDGSHAFLFTAKITSDSLVGEFRSGSHWRQGWSAELFKEYKLTDPATLTTNTTDQVDFAFPDENGQVISLSDSAYHNMPVIISVMGTWCPNCLDEAVFLKEKQDEFSQTDLKIIALDFELISDSTQARKNIRKFKTSIGADFPVLLASLKSTKTKAGQTLPFLSGITSYPTMIVLDHKHEIVKIHTGFTGPATGAVYDEFYKEYSALFNSLL